MARHLSADEYEAIGRRYYKQQQYQKAVDAFTEAIEAANPPTLTLYGQRSACYDKLQDFGSALKDCRSMIKLDKSYVKGYLATGAFLQKTGKEEKALEIYRYGLKSVPTSNKDYKTLQQIHDQLTRKLSPALSLDPFTVLPLEIAEMIISYLNFRQLINCLRVSKGWKTFLTQNPRLWTTLDLSEARRDVSRASVRNAVRYAKGNVQKAVIHRFRHSDMIENLASACKVLSEFHLLSGGPMPNTLLHLVRSAHALKKLVVTTTIAAETMHQILSELPTLEYAAFSDIDSWNRDWTCPALPRLKRLSLQGADHNILTSTVFLGNALQQTPILEALTLRGFCPRPGDLSCLPLKHLETPIFPPGSDIWLPQTLESFYFREGRPRSLRSPGLPRLKTLSAEFDQDISTAFWKQFLDGEQVGGDAAGSDAPSVLDMSFLQNIRLVVPGEEPIALLKSSPRILTPYLETMDVAGCYYLNDAHLDDDFIERLGGPERKPALHTINLSRTSVTGAGVKLLIDNIPSLRTLRLENCSRITSRDIVSYAEKRGIAVSMNLEEVKRKRGPAFEGRRVRYE